MKWPFRRREPSAVEILTGAEWTCRSCGQQHSGMFDIGALAPDPWRGPREPEPNSAVRLEGNFLGTDLCVIEGEHFMVRCILEIPVHGMAESFSYGAWGSLKKENFELYIQEFEKGSGEVGPWWSWLCNQLKPFVEDESVICWMYPQAGNQRPHLWVDSEDHPLALAQRQGISPEEVLKIYEAYGHAPAT